MVSYDMLYQRCGGPPGCSGTYARLGAYAAGFRGIRPPVPTTTVSGYYVVPNYSAPGYNTLQHGPADCCSGNGPYFQIGKAYGEGAGNCCTKYMGALCR